MGGNGWRVGDVMVGSTIEQDAISEFARLQDATRLHDLVADCRLHSGLALENQDE